MTTWNIPAGATVAIIGTGASATPEALESVRSMPRIACNAAVKLAPDADVLVSIDANWPMDAIGFTGLRVVGVPGDYAAEYVGVAYERVQMSAYEVLHIRNNGLLALRIAAKAGAKKIVLVGFDPVAYEAHQAASGYAGFRGYVEGLAQVKAELQAAGIEVVHAESAAPAAFDKPSKRK